ncbi:DUF1289 domain-containing protein [Agrobacterium bohemicum]|uniref:DUF1289 domain-containing protein n=1 Tax=Agrobacterium bohemicum TaxID=2052828 RepID=UPI0009EAB431|nr:DUF1289 domain-containing protein [Agrobacterium bohemicum]
METPCINICSLNTPDGSCAGCYRSIDEIMNWSRYTDDERRKIMNDLPRRSDGRRSVNNEETLIA